MPALGLLKRKFNIASRCQRNYLKPVRKGPNHTQGAAADATGRPQNRNALHGCRYGTRKAQRTLTLRLAIFKNTFVASGFIEFGGGSSNRKATMCQSPACPDFYNRGVGQAFKA